MIERIYAKNFRRIGECDIDLRDGLTVLIGKNGTGKSSIIEAITFNLYGKVKDGTSKDTVRRKNAEEGDPTIAIVDFKLGDAYYRCRRWYTPKMSTMATLYSFTPEQYEELCQKPILDFDKEFGTEVASSTTGVTTAVTDLLGITFDGFKASFVAQQKELNSFAGLAPESRKKFFLDLLGYATLDKVKPELATKVKTLKATVESLEGQNLNVDEIQRRILNGEKQMTKHEASIKKGTDMLEETEGKYSVATSEYEESRIVREKVMGYQDDVAKLSQEKTSLIQDCGELEERIKANTEATKDFDASTSIAEQLHDAEERSRKNKEYQQAKSEKEQLESVLRDAEKELADANAEIERLAKATSSKPDLTAPTQNLQAQRDRYNEHNNDQKHYISDADRLQKLIASVEAGEMAKCPTCGSSIGDAEGKQHLTEELDQVRASMEENQKTMEECKAQGKEAADVLEREQRALETFNQDQKSLDIIKQRAQSLRSTIDERKGRFEAATAKESSLSAAALAQKDEFLLNEEIIKLAQQKENEDKMRALVNQLASDKQALGFKKERIEAIDKELAERNAYIKENKRIAESADKKLEQKQKLEQKLSQYRDRLGELNEQRAECNGALEADRGNLEKAIQQSEQLATLKDDSEDAICAQLVVETLRKELPTRIAPRLSDVAGHILDIATNGRYSVLELDDKYNVNVYTDDDIRSISQMSGGEADVIALSMRIAIAKILLEASGMPTQTFILDEIFGALDDERRESTCTALANIQNELSKILCITHIDEIKDMADYTYVVEMDENGVSWVREQVDAPASMAQAFKEAVKAEKEREADGASGSDGEEESEAA